MAKPLVKVQNLTKQYGDYLAVDRLSFEIQPGEIMGLLGPNGAGKSTTIQMLLGLTEADGGKIEYFGKDFFHEREACLKLMNFASAYAELQGRMTIAQNLEVFGLLYEVKDYKARIQYLLEMLEIEAHANTLFWKLSSGQKTRAILAKSLLNRPQLLLMDEPTASLDPDIVVKVIDLIKRLQQEENITVLYTSHNMEEVARLCDHVLFLAHGKTVAYDTPHELTKQVGLAKLIISFDGEQKKVGNYLEKQKLSHTLVNPHLVEIEVSEPDIPKILFGLKEQGIWVTNISIEKPSLEDVFLHVSHHQKL